MTPLLSLLLNDLPPGLWHLDGFDSVQHRLVEAFNHRPVIIDIDPQGEKADLLDRAAHRLAFPDWFGRNWDALNDALFDLPRSLDATATNPSSPTGDRADLIVIRALDQPDAEAAVDIEPGEDATVLLGIFSDVAQEARRCVVVAGIAAGSDFTAG